MPDTEYCVFHYKKFKDAVAERDKLREENKKLHIEAIKLMREEVDNLQKENKRLKDEVNRLSITRRKEGGYEQQMGI